MELGPFINRVADWFGESSIIASVFDNPIYVAIVMTIIVVIIFYLSARDSFARPAAKVFITIMALMFIYHRRFQKRYDQEARAHDIADALATPSMIAEPTDVAVVPPVYMQSSMMSQTMHAPSAQ